LQPFEIPEEDLQLLIQTSSLMWMISYEAMDNEDWLCLDISGYFVFPWSFLQWFSLERKILLLPEVSRFFFFCSFLFLFFFVNSVIGWFPTHNDNANTLHNDNITTTTTTLQQLYNNNVTTPSSTSTTTSIIV
jgi:hypothetical protein